MKQVSDAICVDGIKLRSIKHGMREVNPSKQNFQNYDRALKLFGILGYFLQDVIVFKFNVIPFPHFFHKLGINFRYY